MKATRAARRKASRRPSQNTKRIFDPIADKVTQYEWGKEVAPGITALDTNGHTPGHTSFQIASGRVRPSTRPMSPPAMRRSISPIRTGMLAGISTGTQAV